MPKTTIASKNGYELIHDLSAKIVVLVKKTDRDTPLMRARFFYDDADGSAVLSDFQSNIEEAGLAKITADMVSDFVSGNKDKCKLFCYPGMRETEFFESKDYRTANIDRLMLRESSKTLTTEVKIPSNIKIHRLDPKTITAENIHQMTALLKEHTYWAKDADEEYTQNAINNSESLLATDQQNRIVGFVRFISNQDIAYISDMVVDTAWRRQQLGTALMQQACKVIDDQKHQFTALISAKEGDGQVAAPRLYGDKFGFEDYAHIHKHNIYFRYIRMVPENVVQNNFVNSYARSPVALFNSSRVIPEILTGIVQAYEKEDNTICRL